MPGLVGQCRAVAAAPSDAALVTAAREGDRVAYGELYARYGRMVHGILLARTPRREVADLVQDVFLTAWRRLGALRRWWVCTRSAEARAATSPGVTGWAI